MAKKLKNIRRDDTSSPGKEERAGKRRLAWLYFDPEMTGDFGLSWVSIVSSAHNIRVDFFTCRVYLQSKCNFLLDTWIVMLYCIGYGTKY